MSRFWNDKVKSIEPYVPGEQPKDKKYIKLNTNENPYPPSPRVLEAIRAAANENLKLYPDPDCMELRNAIAEYYGLYSSQVFTGNGSDELLAFTFMAFFSPDKKILFPDVTYSFYPVYSHIFNIPYDLVPVDDDFNIPVERFYGSEGGIIFPNPNAPTGRCLAVESIKDILEHNKNCAVVVDEAYIDFGGESAVKLINNYPNLLVIQTFSKSRSLAGMRAGFALGHPELIEGLNRIKNSFNSYTLDRLAQVAAKEAIKDRDYFEETTRKVVATRERVSSELAEMGFRVIESKANFIFISNAGIKAVTLFNELKERGILVRHFNKPRIDNYLRVSIGSDEEMDCFLEAVKEIIHSKKYSA